MMTPNQTRSIPIFSATGARIGITMNAISKKSMNIPRMNISTLTAIRNPSGPPGSLSNRCSTQMWPSAALNVKLNTVEPIRMNSTKQDSLAVLSSACLSKSKLSWRRAVAMIRAPNAPIAPPSVGVAIPRKIVPRTRKIRTRGGISTNVTRSESKDSNPSFVRRFANASPSAVKAAIVIDITSTSSVGASPSRFIRGLMMPSWTLAQRTPAPTAINMSSSKDL